MSTSRRRSVGALRTSSQRRGLLLAALALLFNFLGSVSMHSRPHDRFDFSAALCLSSGAAPAGRPAPSAPAELPAEQAPGGAATCCPLCCAGDVPLAATTLLPRLRTAGRILRVAIPAGMAVRSTAWRPHHARAPPFSL